MSRCLFGQHLVVAVEEACVVLILNTCDVPDGVAETKVHKYEGTMGEGREGRESGGKEEDHL